ncbi:MAG: DotI/IcmL family type IV secretion protein [Legionella sp.]|uniref:DotI/IcmL family type IV secretion protein n=1 Tax=Legionella sp. TaxID=459 RepID=UPI0039E3CA90
MKNTIIWSALFTLISTQVYADPAQSVTTTPAPASAPTPITSPVTPPPNPGPAQAPAAPVIDCNYKISAQTKKVEQSILLTWSQNATIQAFTFNPATIDEQIQKLQACFTEQGWTGFNTALQKSGNVAAIKSQNLQVSSQIDGQVLVNEVKDNQWKLTLPLMVVYQNEKEKVSQLLNVDLTVNRKPNGDLGITQMIAAPRGTVTTKKPVQEPTNPENKNVNPPAN